MRTHAAWPGQTHPCLQRSLPNWAAQPSASRLPTASAITLASWSAGRASRHAPSRSAWRPRRISAHWPAAGITNCARHFRRSGGRRQCRRKLPLFGVEYWPARCKSAARLGTVQPRQAPPGVAPGGRSLPPASLCWHARARVCHHTAQALHVPGGAEVAAARSSSCQRPSKRAIVEEQSPSFSRTRAASTPGPAFQTVHQLPVVALRGGVGRLAPRLVARLLQVGQRPCPARRCARSGRPAPPRARARRCVPPAPRPRAGAAERRRAAPRSASTTSRITSWANARRRLPPPPAGAPGRRPPAPPAPLLRQPGHGRQQGVRRHAAHHRRHAQQHPRRLGQRRHPLAHALRHVPRHAASRAAVPRRRSACAQLTRKKGTPPARCSTRAAAAGARRRPRMRPAGRRAAAPPPPGPAGRSGVVTRQPGLRPGRPAGAPSGSSGRHLGVAVGAHHAQRRRRAPPQPAPPAGPGHRRRPTAGRRAPAACPAGPATLARKRATAANISRRSCSGGSVQAGSGSIGPAASSGSRRTSQAQPCRSAAVWAAPGRCRCSAGARSSSGA